MNTPHRARKRFGQNFLHDPLVIQRIADNINPQPDQHLVEIGPGMGALTRFLLPRCGRLDAIELDRDLVPILKQACRVLGDLHVHNADALRFDMHSLIEDGEKLRIVGNLPYNISTPLLFHLISQIEIIEDMHFMLQKEVVDRITAAAGSRDYGRLSVMAQYYCQAERLFIVKPGAFNPAPRVDSAIIRLRPHHSKPVEVHDMKGFSALVTKAFSQRRKTIRNALKGLLSEADISGLGIDPGVRPEVLQLNDFANLSNLLTPADARQLADTNSGLPK